jgi:flagellar biosynthetic protein FlhB
MNPLSGLKKMVSAKSLVELIKSVVKIVIIGLVVNDVFKAKAKEVPALMTHDLNSSLKYMIDTSMDIAFRVGIFLAIYAAGDYFYQWWEYEKNLRMTKQEVKEEYKQMEGDPKIKGQIRQKQRQMGMMRMMQAVPSADVVITNPTHYAIALKYDQKVSRAPVVVAKGKDAIALRIKEKAKESNVQMVENRPLAQALYVSTDIGEAIPEDLYKAVAEILAQVYKLKKR